MIQVQSCMILTLNSTPYNVEFVTACGWLYSSL